MLKTILFTLTTHKNNHIKTFKFEKFPFFINTGVTCYFLWKSRSGYYENLKHYRVIEWGNKRH